MNERPITPAADQFVALEIANGATPRQAHVRTDNISYAMQQCASIGSGNPLLNFAHLYLAKTK